jgi:dTDP-4-amino-4,6-dideoxygalactose transaminase
VWEGCTPVFVDIDPEHLTIDETLIEAAITPRTTAILATHVFGNPCNIEAIETIAEKHGLKVLYDAAHCFGVTYKGKSIFEYGDVSTCSFHATKLFHMGEGGAAFCKDADLRHRVYYSHNFGHNGPLDFHGLGINAKVSELQAAMGLSVLPHMDTILSGRKLAVDFYDEHLDFSKLRRLSIRSGTGWNYSYYPVILATENVLLTVLEKLNGHGIFPRRYFYPSLNTLDYANGAASPVSEDIARRVLCLPLYADVPTDVCEMVVRQINSALE